MQSFYKYLKSMDPHPDFIITAPPLAISAVMLAAKIPGQYDPEDRCSTSVSLYTATYLQAGLCRPYFLSFSTSVVRRIPSRLAACATTPPESVRACFI